MSSPLETSPPSEQAWETLSVGSELSATVLMASGFVLPGEQRVRERYRVLRALGTGGMGQVLAVSLLGGNEAQEFALKVVARPEKSEDDDEAQSQAEQFARLLRQEAAKQDVVQRHGVSVARLFALVRLDDGALGMRMERARGYSLDAYIDEQQSKFDAPPDFRFILLTVRKLLGQLRLLHEIEEPGSPVGFVHSDIKPGNVFVDARDPGDPFVTLLDFGVATAGQAMVRVASKQPKRRTTLVLEQTGGTIGYAPPHHFTGRVTPLSDVYATLVIFYELLTLQWPWKGGDLPRTPINVFRYEKIMESPPRSLCSLRASIPEREGTLLDQFFRDEFGTLRLLAEEYNAACRLEPETVEETVGHRLRALASDYQRKVDELLALFGSATGTAPVLPAVIEVRDSSRPTRELGPPPRPPTPVPELEVVPTPPKKNSIGARIALFAAMLSIGVVSFAYTAGFTRRVPTRTAAPPQQVHVLEVHEPPPPPRRTEHPCSCEANRPGVRVMARGGSLQTPVELCRAHETTEDAATVFRGSGNVSAEIMAAFPSYSCEDEQQNAFELTVERPQGPNGSSHFRCVHLALPTVTVADPVPPTAVDSSVASVDASVPPPVHIARAHVPARPPPRPHAVSHRVTRAAHPAARTTRRPAHPPARNTARTRTTTRPRTPPHAPPRRR